MVLSYFSIVWLCLSLIWRIRQYPGRWLAFQCTRWSRACHEPTSAIHIHCAHIGDSKQSGLASGNLVLSGCFELTSDPCLNNSVHTTIWAVHTTGTPTATPTVAPTVTPTITPTVTPTVTPTITPIIPETEACSGDNGYSSAHHVSVNVLHRHRDVHDPVGM